MSAELFILFPTRYDLRKDYVELLIYSNICIFVTEKVTLPFHGAYIYASNYILEALGIQHMAKHK